MVMKLPKVRMMGSSVKTPKIAIPRVNFVSKPNVGSISAKGRTAKLKIKYK